MIGHVVFTYVTSSRHLHVLELHGTNDIIVIYMFNAIIDLVRSSLMSSNFFELMLGPSLCLSFFKNLCD